MQDERTWFPFDFKVAPADQVIAGRYRLGQLLGIAGPQMAAAALGLVIVVFGLGQTAGPLLAGWLKDASGSLELPLQAAAGIAWGGALLSLAVKSSSPTSEPGKGT